MSRNDGFEIDLTSGGPPIGTPVGFKLGDISDVVIPNVLSGQFLQFNGTDWVNVTINPSGVVTSGSPIAGEFAQFTDPNTITGLSDAAMRTALGLVIGTDVQAYSAVLDSTTASYTIAEQDKLAAIEPLADVTDAANVEAAGALMDSEIDQDLKTLSLPANTTITAFAATILDDANAPEARATLDVDQAGTDNSTNVTLVGTGTYLSIVGQAITVDPITESDISDLQAYITDYTVTQGDVTAHEAAINHDALLNFTTLEHFTQAAISIPLSQINDITATAAEVNLLDLSGLTAGWVLSADTATTASWKAPGELTWGNITGTLSNQTDLQSALDLKATAADLTSHTGNSSIHFTQASISITESQISDLQAYITDYTVTEGDVTAHVGAIDHDQLLNFAANEHFTQAAISIPASQITDFDTEVSNNASVVANTAKVSNATHTGDVTGSTVLTIAVDAVDIPMLSATGTADATTFLRGDNTWATPDAGGTPGGADTQLQYNNAGAFGGMSEWTYNNGTGAVTSTAALTVAEFTSTGIDDNATAERLQIEDGSISFGAADLDYVLKHKADDRWTIISGGSSSASGAIIVLYGGSHANTGDMEFRNDSNAFFRWDESGGDMYFYTGTGPKTQALQLRDDLQAMFAGTINSKDIVMSDSSPNLIQYQSDAALDQKRWNMLVSGEDLVFRLGDDANSNFYTWLQVQRSGTGSGVQADTIDLSAETDITLNAPTIINANLKLYDTDPNIHLWDSNGTATHQRMAFQLNNDVFALKIRDSVNALVSTPYAITMGASGATVHDFKIANSTILYLTTNNVYTYQKTHIQEGNGVTATFGADSAANTLTDATTKQSRVGVPHYTNAQEPMALWFAQSNDTVSSLQIGGGTSHLNMITDLYVHLAADNTTTGGNAVLHMTRTTADWGEAGSEFNFRMNDDDQYLLISGGNTTTSGANAIFYGGTHNNAGDLVLRNDGNHIAHWDESQGSWFFYHGVGAKTLGLTLADDGEIIVGNGSVMSLYPTNNVATGPDIQFFSAGLIAGEGSMYFSIDSDNSGTGSSFLWLRDADNSSGNELMTLSELGQLHIKSGGSFLLNSTATDGWQQIATDDTANAAFTAFDLDVNMSGADALTADRSHVGMNIDVDSTATGGDTTDEHRVYALKIDTNVTGDSDLVYGIYNYAKAVHAAGTIGSLYGMYNLAHDGSTASSVTGSIYGVYSESRAESTSGEGVILYGAYNRSRVLDGNTTIITAMTGQYGSILVDDPTIAGYTITSAYATRSIIDNNSITNAATISNAYLFHGDYADTNNITNTWGIYIAETFARNWFGGTLNVGAANSVVGPLAVYDTTDGTISRTYIDDTGDIHIATTNSPDMLQLADSGAPDEISCSAYIEFGWSTVIGGSYNRTAYMGFGSSSNNNFTLKNETVDGLIELDAAGDIVLSTASNNWFHADESAGTIRMYTGAAGPKTLALTFASDQVATFTNSVVVDLGMQVGDADGQVTDFERNINFWGDGTNAHATSWYNKLKLFGGSAQTRHIELYQIDSGDAYIESTYGVLNIGTTGNNANIVLNTHGTGDTLFQANSNTWMDWDESVGDVSIYTGVGAKTLAMNINTNQNASFYGQNLSLENADPNLILKNTGLDDIQIFFRTSTSDTVSRLMWDESAKRIDWRVFTPNYTDVAVNMRAQQAGNFVFLVGGTDGGTAASSVTFSTIPGTITLGVQDTTPGQIRLSGDGTLSDVGGEARFYLAADHDTTFDYFIIDANQDDLRITRNSGSAYMSFYGGTGQIQVDAPLRLTTYTETHLSYTVTTGTKTLDLSAATYFYPSADMGTATITFAWSNITAARTTSWMVELEGANDATIIWPAEVEWGDAGEPTYTAGRDVIAFWTRLSGTRVFAAAVMLNAA